MRRLLEAALILALVGAAQPAWAQFAGAALYEIGTTTTDVGADEGHASFAYGLGLRGSYSFLGERPGRLAIGGDALVRGFGVDIPERAQESAGVFDQSDLVIDEWVAVRVGPLLAGVYLEQRRIERSTSLGTIGFPAAGVGFLVEPRLTASGRTRARFSYARFQGGRLRLAGTATEPELSSGRSLRVSLRQQLTERWGVHAEYADVRLEFEGVPPTLAFFDHRQSALSLGAFLSF